MNGAQNNILDSNFLSYLFQQLQGSTIQHNLHQFKTGSGCYGPNLTAPARNLISNTVI